MVAPVRLVIFGSWSEDWMRALGPSSEMWIDHPIVKEIAIIVDIDKQKIPPPLNPSLITVLLPLMEWHIIKCPKDYVALVSPSNVITTLAIKSDFNSYMNRINCSNLIPISYDHLDQIKYPAVLKRVDLNAGNGVVLIDSMSLLRLRLDNEKWLHKPIIVQEFIDGETEYVTHLICKNGEILWHTTFSFELTPQEKIRNPSNVKSINRITTNEFILSKFRECLKPLNFSGPCNIDFKLTTQGLIKILEINPRFGGTLMSIENRDLLKQAIECLLLTCLKIDV